MNQLQNIKALDHYFDQGDYLREQRLPIGVPLTPLFVDRGDPAAADKTAATLTIDSAWHDWDLSSVVPDGAKWVLIRYSVLNTGAGWEIDLRKKGSVNLFNVARAVGVVNTAYMGDLHVPCDSNRVISYFVLNAGVYTSLDLTIGGWWK